MTVLVDFSERDDLPVEVREAADRYGISTIPVSIFLTPDGEEIDRRVGGFEAEELVSLLADIAREHGRDPAFWPSLDAAVEAAAQGDERRRVAVLAGPDSEFARGIEDARMSDESASRFAWVREVRDGDLEIRFHEVDEARTVGGRRSLAPREDASAAAVLAEALAAAPAVVTLRVSGMT